MAGTEASSRRAWFREGKFSDIAANLGPLPMGFAQFLVDKDGKQDVIRLTLFPPGQVYELKREPQ